MQDFENLTDPDEIEIEEIPEELGISLLYQIGCDEIVQQFISGLWEYRDSLLVNEEIPELNESHEKNTIEEVLIVD